MMVYAAPGIGKTVLLGSAVDVLSMRDVLYISAESGDMSLLGTDRIKEPEMIDIIRVTTFKQIVQVKDFVFAHCKYREAGNEEALWTLQNKFMPGLDRLRKYHTVVLDSLSEAEAYNMTDLLGLDNNMLLSDDMVVAEFKEYKQNHSKLQMLVRAFRDLPMHVLMSCHQQYTQDEMKKYHYTLSLTGKLSSQIQGFFDIVGWLTSQANATEDKEAPRRLWVQPIGGRYDAKCRRASLKKPYLDNPTMTTIMEQTGLSTKARA